MSINLTSSNIATRENRIGSITGYVGTLKDLATKSECGTLKGCSRCFSQSSTCLSMCGLSQLAAIRNVAIIHHGPAGCSVTSANAYYMAKVMANALKMGCNNACMKRIVAAPTAGASLSRRGRSPRFSLWFSILLSFQDRRAALQK